MSINTLTSSSGFIERLFNELDQLLNQFVYNSYHSLANHLTYPLGIAVCLLITILGLSISQGWVKLSMDNFIKVALKIGFIYTFALNWDVFSSWIVGGIGHSAGQIGHWLIEANANAFPGGAGHSINGALQAVLNEVMQLGDEVFDKGGWRNWGPLFAALIIWSFGFAVVLIAVLELVLAKMMLAVLFATAPLFVIFTLFKVTHTFFDRWLGAIMGFCFLLIFISATLALPLSLMQWIVNSSTPDPSISNFIPIMVVGFVSAGMLLKVATLANSIGGTITTSSGSALLAGTIGGFVGGSIAAGQYGKNVSAVAGQAMGGAGRAASSMVSAVRNKLRGGGE